MDRYELVEGNSSKFWAVKVEGNTLTVNFGRLGAQGQTKEKVFANGDQAALEKNKLVAEKTKKGYALVQSDEGASASKQQAQARRPIEEGSEAGHESHQRDSAEKSAEKSCDKSAAVAAAQRASSRLLPRSWQRRVRRLTRRRL